MPSLSRQCLDTTDSVNRRCKRKECHFAWGLAHLDPGGTLRCGPHGGGFRPV